MVGDAVVLPDGRWGELWYIRTTSVAIVRVELPKGYEHVDCYVSLLRAVGNRS